MSFAFSLRGERRRQVTAVRELRALAHPLRLAILDHLMSFGEQTAARCAEAVGSTTSNCSYHLRALARAGFVERADSADGRERPWMATSTGLTWPDDIELSPAAAAAALVLDELSLARGEELTRQARRRHDEQPAEWRAAEAYHDYGLNMSAAELAELAARIDRLVRPFIAMTRHDAPEDAQVVLLRLLAFRYPRSP